MFRILRDPDRRRSSSGRRPRKRRRRSCGAGHRRRSSTARRCGGRVRRCQVPGSGWSRASGAHPPSRAGRGRRGRRDSSLWVREQPYQLRRSAATGTQRSSVASDRHDVVMDRLAWSEVIGRLADAKNYWLHTTNPAGAPTRLRVGSDRHRSLDPPLGVGAMKRGLFVAPFDELVNPRLLAGSRACGRPRRTASSWGPRDATAPPVREVADVWVALSAIASATSNLRLGPLVTPSRADESTRLPRETVTLDLLSEGRLTFGVGPAATPRGSWSPRRGDRSARASPAARRGPRTIDRVLERRTPPRPVQQPSIPIWVAARWPSRHRCNAPPAGMGLFPIELPGPAELAQLADETRQCGQTVVSSISSWISRRIRSGTVGTGRRDLGAHQLRAPATGGGRSGLHPGGP